MYNAIIFGLDEYIQMETFMKEDGKWAATMGRECLSMKMEAN